MLVVFGIDGTLANIEHRLDYVRWDACAETNGKYKHTTEIAERFD